MNNDSLQLALLYLCVSPDSPFAETAQPSQAVETLTYSSPLPTPLRSWTPWTSFRLFDPQLVGYLPHSALQSSISSITPDRSTEDVDGIRTSSEDSNIPPESTSGSESKRSRLPPGYVDLRWGGFGFVLDLGLKRTDEGLSWEGKVGSLPATQTDVQLEGVTHIDSAVEPASPEAPNAGTPAGASVVAEETSAKTLKPRNSPGGMWTRLPLVGDL